MSVSLRKNEKLSLSKSNKGLKHVFMGLGWDAAKGGFFQTLLGMGPTNIDLDASCLMFDSANNLIDTVWFRQLESRDGSVVHSGDNLTGDGDGDDEVINVDLTQLPKNIKTLVFVITSFRGQTFKDISSATCRLVDSDSNKELAQYVLSEKSDNTAQIMAKVYQENDEWVMQALGVPANGRVQTELLPQVLKYL